MNAGSQTLDQQQLKNAYNYGVSLTEELSSQSFSYDSLDVNFGGLDDIYNELKRRSFVTATNDTLAATIELSSEQNIVVGAIGRIATVTIYRVEDGEPEQVAELFTTIVPFSTN